MTVAAVEPIAAEAAGTATGSAAGSATAEGSAGKTLRTPRAGKGSMATAYPTDGKPKSSTPAKPKPSTAKPKSSTPTEPKPKPVEDSSPDFAAGISGGSVDVGTMVLIFLGWVWVGLPLLTGGPAKVKALWQAKWLNQAPDGQELP